MPLLSLQVSGPYDRVKLQQNPHPVRTPRPTVLFLIRWFLILRVNHSFEVAPVSYLPGGSFAIASAITWLWSANGRKRTEYPGLVK